MTNIAQALSLALLHFVWQGLVIAFLLWATLFFLRRSTANARYLASSAGLILLVLAPVVTACILFRSPVAAAGPELDSVPSANEVIRVAFSRAAPIAWTAAFQMWALPVWSFGVFLFSMRLVWGYRQVGLLRRHGTPVEESVHELVAGLAARMRLARPVRVLLTPAAESPSVIGWIRPAILLPAATLLNLTPDQLNAVLAHELAHIRRHDYLVNLLQFVAETLLFYHPAVWWASARMRHERELCCDDLAVHCCGDALCYARALTRLERLRLSAPAMAIGSNGGSMAYRIQRLLGVARQDCAPSKLPVILALAFGIVGLVLTMQHARGQEKTIAVAFAPTHQEFETVDAPLDGSGIEVDLQGAAIIHRTSVEYPDVARERKIEGTVLVEVGLDASGTVDDARILAGPSELRKAVLQSVLQWHFAPGAAGASRHISISFRHVEGQDRLPEDTIRRFFFPGGNNAEHEARAREGFHASQAKPSAAGQTQESGGAVWTAAVRRFDEIRQHGAGHEAATRKLTRIEMPGLSGPQQAALRSRLPVRLGDTISPESIESLNRAVRNFDEHLEVNLEVTEGNGVAVRIFVGGSGGVFIMRNQSLEEVRK